MYAVNVFVFAIYTSSGFDHLFVKAHSYMSVCVCCTAHMCERAQRVLLTHISITYCVSFCVWHLQSTLIINGQKKADTLFLFACAYS